MLVSMQSKKYVLRNQIVSHSIGLVVLPLVFLLGCGDIEVTSNSQNTLRIAIKAEPPTLDGSLATDNVSFDILTNIMEGLTQYNSKLEPVPAIAKRWEFSDQGRTLTFFLRNDVKWSDGKLVTAGDFEYSWKRLLNPATAAEYAYFLFDIENAYEYNSGKIKNADQVGVRALSPSVLQVRLKRPVIYFPSITTFMVTFPLRKDVIERFGDHWTDPKNIITNGPFLLKEWQHEYKLVLNANKSFYEGPPEIDQINIYIVREATTELTLYETGELDMVELPPVAIPHYQNSPEYLNLPLLRGYYYGFNVQKPPFDDVRIRQALAYAIDRKRIPKILNGGELPSASWIPKGMFGYNKKIGPKFNPEKANKLLSSAGYPNGKNFPEFSITYNSDPANRLIAQFIQAQWKEHLNIHAQLEDQEWKVFLSRLKVDPPSIFRLGWGADFPDPDNFMNLFTSSSGNNHLRWGNSTYDQLIQQGAAEQNLQLRKSIYDRAQKILTEKDTPIISLFTSAQNILVKPYIQGLETNAMELLYLKKVKIAR